MAPSLRNTGALIIGYKATQKLNEFNLRRAYFQKLCVQFLYYLFISGTIGFIGTKNLFNLLKPLKVLNML